MRIATGTVIDGKVVVDGEPLVEGAKVAVLSSDEDTFELDSSEERELVAALSEARRGEGIDGDTFLDQLDAQQ